MRHLKSIVIFAASFFMYFLFVCGVGFFFSWVWGLSLNEAINTKTGEPISPHLLMVVIGAIHVGLLYCLYSASDFAAHMVKNLNNS